jgi:hypothetical protein
MLRDDFSSKVGMTFDFNALASQDMFVCTSIVDLGADLYAAIEELC